MNLNFIKPIATFIIIIFISMSHEFVNETVVNEPAVEKTEANYRVDGSAQIYQKETRQKTAWW